MTHFVGGIVVTIVAALIFWGLTYDPGGITRRTADRLPVAACVEAARK